VSTGGEEKDRRRFRRYEISLPIRYAPRQYQSDVPPDLWEGTLVNISRSGAAIKLMHRLRRGGTLEISFIQHNPPRCVSVVGKVIRSELLPGLHALTLDGTARGAHLAAVEFARVLDIEELATLREAPALDATVVEKSKKE